MRADTALYRAEVDRNTFRFFEPSMDRLAAERRALDGVVAEGIEDERQLAAAASLGCNQGQGFLLGRPEPLVVHLVPEA